MSYVELKRFLFRNHEKKKTYATNIIEKMKTKIIKRIKDSESESQE